MVGISQYLSEVLSVDQKVFDRFIQRLERANLYPGVDVKLALDCKQHVQDKLRQLGLDASDTAPEELHHALIARLQRDEGLLYNALKTKEELSYETIVRTVSRVSSQEKTLAMSPAAVKRVLLSTPPRRTMKLLKFRSLEAVMKRESPLVLYTVACHYEDASWRSQVLARLKRLSARDVDLRPITYATLPASWSDKLKNTGIPHAILMSNAESGTVVLLPVIDHTRPGSLMLTMTILMQTGQRMVIESVPHRVESFVIGHEQALPALATMYGQPNQLAKIHGLDLTWHAVVEYMGRSRDMTLLADAEFVMQDMEWSTTEQKIVELVPELSFWLDSHYLGLPVVGKKPISFHVTDVAATMAAKMFYGEQVCRHLQASLWNELQVRYLQQDVMRRAIQKQLSQNMSGMI